MYIEFAPIFFDTRPMRSKRFYPLFARASRHRREIVKRNRRSAGRIGTKRRSTCRRRHRIGLARRLELPWKRKFADAFLFVVAGKIIGLGGLNRPARTNCIAIVAAHA